MIARACYVTCDQCGDPAPISTEDARDARALAAIAGFIRQDALDICVRCRTDPEAIQDRMRVESRTE